MKVNVREVIDLIDGWNDQSLVNTVSRQEAQLMHAALPKLRKNYKHHRGNHENHSRMNNPDGIHRRRIKKMD